MKLHHKNTFIPGLGAWEKVFLIGTNNLVPRPRVRKETQHGYEAKVPSPYEPHPEVIQHFKCT